MVNGDGVDFAVSLPRMVGGELCVIYQSAVTHLSLLPVLLVLLVPVTDFVFLLI